MDSLWGLYLEYRKDTEQFNRFVILKAEELERQRSEDKQGA